MPVLALAAITLAACSGTPTAAVTVTVTSSASASTPTETATASSTPPEPTTAPATPEPPVADGSQASPYALGQEGQVGEWTGAVASVDTNATGRVMAANDLSDHPKAGQTYILVKAHLTYQGTTTGDPNSTLSAGFLGADHRIYSSLDTSCVGPNDLNLEPKVVSGGTVAGTVCLIVPKSVLAGGGLVYLDDVIGDQQVWWRLPK